MCAAKATRARKTRLELEIERNRAEGNLTKALEQAYPLKGERGGPSASLFHLVFCENKLEPAEKDCSSAIDFAGAESAAEDALRTASDDQYRLEALILKAKIAFIRENYATVVELLDGVDLKNAKIESYTARFVRLLCEGLAMLGLSKERTASKTETMLSPEICDCYELAGNMCIRHLQELESSVPESVLPIGIPKVVELAIKRRVLIPLQQNNVIDAVSRFRNLMRFVETPSTRPLRQLLARQLAELLLRIVSSGNYQKCLTASDSNVPMNQVVEYRRPRRYSADRFVPDDQLQEAILMLLISEYIASQEVILNRSAELSQERQRTVNEAIAVYDLLAIALVRKGCFSFLSKTLERALKFAYCEFQIWYQFALSLISSRKYYRAYLILRECQRIDPSKPSIYLLASSLCLGHLHLIEEGMVFASKGIEVTSKSDEPCLCARAHLMLGWGYSLSARECRMLQKKNELHRLAVEEYTTATKKDPDDHLAWYHLGVELAIQRQIEEAFKACQRSILLAPLVPNTIRLLALLHTAAASGASGTSGGGNRRRRLEQAIRALRGGLADQPTDFGLLFTLALVETELNGAQAGLLVYMQMLEQWRDCFNAACDNTALRDHLQLVANSHSNTESVTVSGATVDFAYTDVTDCEAGINFAGDSCGLPSLTRLETTFAEIAGARTPQPPTSPTKPSIKNSVPAFSLLAKILGAMAELYLSLDRKRDAQACVEEAISRSQLSHELIYLRGRVLEADGQVESARAMYESAIAINPSHVKALYALARILRDSEQYILAEQVLRDALAVDSTNSRVWCLLGEVLSSSSTSDPDSKATATTAFLSAVELEQSEPVEPFHTLRLGVYCS
uniref:Tetratricopeptide repeat protein 7 N-terminal domain-containing protein n=1 Tax=Schistocephalus solidus TaxID=70667 RepID=A0A0X3NYY4_SCHSO